MDDKGLGGGDEGVVLTRLSDGLFDGDLTTGGFTVAFHGSLRCNRSWPNRYWPNVWFFIFFGVFSGSFPGLTFGIFGFTFGLVFWPFSVFTSNGKIIRINLLFVMPSRSSVKYQITK